MQNPGTRDFPVINLDSYNAYVQWPVDMPFYPERVRANAQGDHAKAGTSDDDGTWLDQGNDFIEVDPKE